MTRNELTAAQRSNLRANFADENGNIFEAFQRNPIVLTKAIYQSLSFNSMCHIRIYFGEDDSLNPKVIAVPAYKLNEIDTPDMENLWDDIYDKDKIYELYSGTVVSITSAKRWIANWAKKSSNELWIKAVIFPRPNFIEIFINQDRDYALLDFGIKKEVTVMSQACAANGAPDQVPIVNDFARPCPPFCNKLTVFVG